MSTTGVPKLNKNRAGQTVTNTKGFSNAQDAPEITIQIRQLAAARGMERPVPSDGNNNSNDTGSAPKSVGKTKPSAPAKASDKGNDPASEKTPPYAKENISEGDGFARARSKAREMYRSS